MSHSVYFTGPLHQRMAEDLHLGGMSERTHSGFLRAARKLADYCQTSPDRVSEDQLRRFFLHMKNELNDAHGMLRVVFSGIKFFYTRTCKRDWRTLQQMKLQHIKSLPEVVNLSSEVRLNVDLDVTLTVIANGCYRWLASKLKGYERAKAKQLSRKFVEASGEITVPPNRRLLLMLDRRSHNPVLREASLDADSRTIAWFNRYRIDFDYR